MKEQAFAEMSRADARKPAEALEAIYTPFEVASKIGRSRQGDEECCFDRVFQDNFIHCWKATKVAVFT